MNRVDEAIKFATIKHSGQYRKLDLTPYIVHPMEVASIIATMTNDEDIIIAGLLHDVVEDTGTPIEEIYDAFGERVKQLVLSETENKHPEMDPSESWQLRKQESLNGLRDSEDIGVKILWLADKLSNLRSFQRAQDKLGPAFWQKLHQSDPERHRWYYKTVADNVKDALGDTHAFREYIFRMSLVWAAKTRHIDVDLPESLSSDTAIEVYDQMVGYYKEAKENGEDVPTFVLNAKDTATITNAGIKSLRMLAHSMDTNSLIILNANKDVYKSLKESGLTDEITIIRTLKKMSVKGCTEIGHGAKGVVYRYDEESIIKVYNDRNSIHDIYQEIERSKKAFVAGVPTAISYSIVDVDGHYGSYFELISASSIAECITKEPNDIDKYAAISANIARTIHAIDTSNIKLPSALDEGLSWVYGGLVFVDKAKARKVAGMLCDLPEQQTMLHCDFHPNNIMLQGEEPLVIDMDRISYGHPIFDLCGLYMACVGFGVVDRKMLEDFLGFSCEIAAHYFRRVLAHYFETEDEEYLQTVENKIALLTYTRLVRRIFKGGLELTDDKKHALDIYMSKIDALLPLVDSFEF